MIRGEVVPDLTPLDGVLGGFALALVSVATLYLCWLLRAPRRGRRG